MLMTSVNYFCVIGCEHVAAKGQREMKATRQATEEAREAYERLPIKQ